MFSHLPSGRHVLVIDDDAVMQELLHALLTAEGYAIHAVGSGEAAVAALRKGTKADTVLCDMQLPGLAGKALNDALRSAAPDARIVGMSGSEPPRELRDDFAAFLLKPFSMEDFAALIESETAPAGHIADEYLRKEASATPPLDEDTYRRLAAGLPAKALAELYQLTLSDVAARLQTLQELVDAQDEIAYRRQAHALKGGCSMVGAAELAALAAQAETGSFSDTPTATEFAAAAERLRSIIAARLTVQF